MQLLRFEVMSRYFLNIVFQTLPRFYAVLWPYILYFLMIGLVARRLMRIQVRLLHKFGKFDKFGPYSHRNSTDSNWEEFQNSNESLKFPRLNNLKNLNFNLNICKNLREISEKHQLTNQR
jgi:hypothetical protein